MQGIKPAASTTPPGIIETLSAGFDHVNQIVWIVAVPIVMDLFLWLAPRVSAGIVINQVAAWYSQLIHTYTSVAGGGVNAATIDQARQAVDALEKSGGSFNLLTLLVVNLASVPSIAPTPMAGRPVWQVGSLGVLGGVILATQLVGILIGCLYLGLIAQKIRDGKVIPRALVRQVWSYWLSVLGFILLAIGLVAVVSIPVGLAIGLVQLVAPAVGVALWFAALAGAQIAIVLLMIYLFFLVDAIVVSEAGPVRAAVNSARVVANNFWSTVGFIVIIYIILLGTQVIWTALSHNSAGLLVAIIGNAYVSSGIAAASMIYYQTRLSRLPAARGGLRRVSQA